MGSAVGVTVGATVVNWTIKYLEKRFNGKRAKFVPGTVLFRVIKVTVEEGRPGLSGWIINWLMESRADRCGVMHTGKIKLILCVE